MRRWLDAVAVNGIWAREELLEEGYHRNVIMRKAEKSARKGYTDYGVVVDRAWLTEKGITHGL